MPSKSIIISGILLSLVFQVVALFIYSYLAYHRSETTLQFDATIQNSTLNQVYREKTYKPEDILTPEIISLDGVNKLYTEKIYEGEVKEIEIINEQDLKLTLLDKEIDILLQDSSKVYYKCNPLKNNRIECNDLRLYEVGVEQLRLGDWIEIRNLYEIDSEGNLSLRRTNAISIK